MAHFQRVVRAACWFLVGLLLATVSAFATAETIPATAGAMWGNGGYGSGPFIYPTAQAACEATGPGTSPNWYFDFRVTPTCTPESSQCDCQAHTNRWGDPAFWEATGRTANKGSGYTCPTGQDWTLNGSTCTRPDCAPGETRDAGGVCQAPACPFGSSKINGIGNCISDTCPDGSARPINGLCRGLSCNGGSPGLPQPPGATIESSCSDQGCASTWWKYDGGSSLRGSGGECNPAAPPPNTECPPGTIKQTLGQTTKCYPATNSCAASGQCSGTANGLTICFACPPGTETAKPTSGSGTKETTTTPPGGTPTTTPGETKEVTETIKAPVFGGGSPTVTRETTTTNPDGTKTVEKETTAMPAYCEKYPSSPTCKEADKGSFSGACGAPPVCSGDAIQCAQAAQALAIACALTPTDTVQSTVGTGAMAGTDAASSPAHPSKLQTVDMSGGFTASETFGAACPADISFSIAGRAHSISMTPVCNTSTWLGYIGVAVSMLVGAFIVVGAIKG